MKMFKKMGSLAENPQKRMVKTPKSTVSFPISTHTLAMKTALGSHSLLLVSFIKVLSNNGDDEDLAYFLNECAHDLFETLIDDKVLSMWESQDNVELVVDEFNRIMLTHNLGYIQLTIAEDEEGEMRIFLYESLLKRVMAYLNKYDMPCGIFYESFFSLFLSNLFQENVIVTEDTTKNSSDKEICYFKAIID